MVSKTAEKTTQKTATHPPETMVFWPYETTWL